MWGPLWQCVSRKPAAPAEGHIVLLNGVAGANLHLISKQLQKNYAVFRRLSSNAAYMPGDGAPADVRYPDPAARVGRLGQLARSFAQNGFITAVELHADWPAYWHRLGEELSGCHAPVTTALVYHHLPELVHHTQAEKAVPSLVQYGALFRGSMGKTPQSLAYLTRKELADTVQRASEAAHKEPEDQRAFYNMLHRYLFTALGFDHSHTVRGVYIEPRIAHDVVLNLSELKPPAAVQLLTRHMQDAARTRRPSATFVTHAAASAVETPQRRMDFSHIPSCTACSRIPTAERAGNKLCGECLEIARAHLRAAPLQAARGVSSSSSSSSSSNPVQLTGPYADIVFILHANESNSEIATSTYLNIIRPKGEFEEILTCIEKNELPIVWSAQGFDMDVIRHENPALLKKLAGSPYVTFTRGWYTHAMPTFHPEGVGQQLRRGAEALQRCGITAAPVGMVPEFDIFPDLIRPLRAAGWRHLLLTHHRPDLKKNILYPAVAAGREAPSEISGDIDLVNVVDDFGESITGLVTHGSNIPRTDLRTMYLLLLRGDVTFDAFLKHLMVAAQATLKNGSPLLVFHIDLEAIQINKAMKYFNHLLEEAAKLHRAGTLRFVGFDDRTIDRLERHIATQPPPNVHLSYMPKLKWYGNTDLYVTNDLKSTDFEGLSPYHKRAYLWATNSDYLSCQFGLNNHKDGVWLTLPTKDFDHPDQAGPTIQLISDSARIQETEYVWQCVKQKKRLGEEISDSPFLQFRRNLPHHWSARWEDLAEPSKEKLKIYDALWSEE